jgi:PKD repeat protein
MNKRLPLLGALLALSIFAFAQHTCNSSQITQARRLADPVYNQQLQSMEAALEKIVATNHIDPAYGQRVVRTVPVVVHVVYRTAAENVSTASINAMIAQMNADFRKLNTDLSTARAVVAPLATDAQIEFCLAQQTPAGAATTGIVRVQTTEVDWDPDTETDEMKYTATGGSPAWNTNQYLNIWIVNITGTAFAGVAGYAYLPTAGMVGSGDDGLVIDYQLGLGGTNNHVASHEIGHYFGLHHTWGDLGSNACGNVFPATDDGFNDTPDSKEPNFGCTVVTSCAGNSSYGDQLENFMDYTDCAVLFTPLQCNYMNATLSGIRSGLLSSQGCTPLGAPLAAFTGTPTSICTGQSVTFTNQTTGAATITYSWSFPGGTPSTSTATNPTVTYNTPGTYNVTLTATNGSGSDNEVKTAYIVVAGSNALPLNEGFQTTTFVPTNWSLNNPDAGDTWERTTVTGGYGASSACALFDNYNSNNPGQRDWLITPSYNFTGVTLGRLKFDHAYRRYNTTTTLYDSLEVMYSTNCGATWTSLWKKGGVSLQTVTTTSTQSFTPSATQWVTDSIDLTTLSAQSNVRFAFININRYGQRLFLDNINLYSATTTPIAPTADFIGTPTTVVAGQSVTFTNQTTGSATITYSWNFPGAATTTSTATNPVITYNTPGTYNVTLTANNGGGTDVETKTNYITVIAAGGGNNCDTLTNLLNTDTLTAYVFNPAAAGGTGFLSGHNSFEDKAKADFFVNPTPGAQVTGGLLYFAFANAGGAGGNITAKIWNANGANGSPGTVLATQNIPVSTIVTNVNAQAITPVTFATPATVTGNFYFGIEFPNFTNGDSVALYSTTFNSPGNGQGWEQWNDLTWHPYDSVYGDLSNAVFPILCTQAAQGPTASFTASATSVCAGSSITFTSSSTGSPTSYSWTINGGTPSVSTAQNPTVVFNTPGTYTISLTVSNANGSNTSTQTNLITVRALPSATVSATGVLCFGGSTGSASVAVTSGQTPYTYAWSGGGTGTSISNKPVGTYTVTVTDANQCSTTASGVVSGPSAAVSATASANDALCNQPNGSVSVVATGGTAGAAGYNYLWNNNQTTANLSNVAAGTYTVTVTDQNGCTATASATVQNLPSNLTASITKTDATCNQNNGTAVAIATGGQFVTGYVWNTGATSGSLSNLAPGSYSVTVTNNNGCTASATTTIGNVPSTMAVTFNITQANCGATNGAAQALPTGGAPGYTYNWSTGSTNAIIAGLGAGGYSLTVTDNAGCSISSVATVGNIGAPTLTASGISPTCFNATNGSATASATGGTTPYNYNWSNGGATSQITNLAAGTYVVSVTDASQCLAVQSVTLTQPTQVTGLVTTTDAACGASNGSVSVLANGGGTSYTYSWSSGQSTATVNNLAAGSYTVTITDNNSCTGTASGVIQNTTGPSASLNAINGSCQAGPQISVSVNGGTAPYSFQWSNGFSTQDLTNIPAGSYTVTVTDNNGCTTSGTASVTDASALSATIAGTNPSTSTAADGSATVTPTSGTAPYSYNWSNGQSTQTATGLTVGSYTVTVTDAAGCTKVLSVTLTAGIGIATVDNITSLSLYPNPANSAVNIAVELSQAQQLQVEIYDHLGQLVWNRQQAQVKGMNEQIDISAYSAGVYYVRVAANGTFKTVKFIKQ